MKIKTKFFITLAILIATLSAFILVSSAEESTATVTVTNVESLNSAISDINVTYIKLGEDITVGAPIVVARDGITIDLNGHTINADNSSSFLFKLELQNMNFTITGSGIFNINRSLYNTMSQISKYVGAKNASVFIRATGDGITFTSLSEYKNSYLTVGAQGQHPDSLNITGKITILNPNCTSAIQIYNSSILNISNSYIKNECESFLYTNGGKAATSPQISFVNTSFYSLGNYVINSTGKYSNLIFEHSYLEYSNCAFKGNSTNNYYLNLIMKDTNTKFTGTVTSENALLSGKGITAVIEGGFHNLNGASLAIGTIPYDSNNGVLIKKGTAISCEFDSYENVMFEEGAETAKWYDKTDGNLIAMGYYDSAQEAVLDTSVLPIVVVDDQHYNLKYTSWKSTYNDRDDSYNFTPDGSTTLPIPDIRGIKYNLSTYTNFNMNIYVPLDIDIIGGYWDANCTYPLNSTSHKIEEEEYLKYSFEFGASDMDRIVMYVKYNAEYKESVYTLIQKIEVSVIDYTESILKGSEFSYIEKQLAADMLRYCNETIKIADGSYNFTASRILETYKEHLTDINSIQLENTDTDCKNLSYYIKEAMLVFNSYEPKFAFRYTENVTSPSASESDSGIWLNITYNSVDGTQKTAKTELNTDNSLFFALGISAYDIDEVLTIRVCAAGKDEPLAEGTFSLSTYILTLESTAIDMTFAKVLYAYSLSAEIYKKSL